MTATLLTVDELREHLETDLADAALQRILDAEEAEIIQRYGPHATATETLSGNGTLLILARTPLTITSITETYETTTTTLAADDYRLWPGGRIERSVYGTNPASYWSPVATVTYVPVDMTAQRRGCLIRLATLAVAYRGVKAESVGSGDYSMTAQDYTTEREKLLRSLAGRKLWIV